MSAALELPPGPPLALDAACTPVVRVAACRDFLSTEQARIRTLHARGASGRVVAQALAEETDRLLRALFEHALACWRARQGEPPSAVALIALGGYGRRELNPLSDIDVMFLFPAGASGPRLKPFQEHLTNEILYPLWDLKLKVGHSTRTLDEVFTEAARDIRTKTSLLESHFIAGTEPLYQSFAETYRNHYLKDDPKAYISARLADQASRRAKYGDTVFLQEPDIKNGVGGLRDYQNALWMARVKLGITRLAQLVELNYLQPAELAEFDAGYDFLLRVRHELHFQSKHPTDLLHLEMQPRVALALGYRQHDILVRVEAFMQDYYRHAQALFRISKIVEHRLALQVEKPGASRISLRDLLRVRKQERTKKIDGFILRGAELAAEHPDVFAEDPVRLVRVFRHCQQLACAPDFDLAALIRRSLGLIDAAVVASSDANESFRALLQDAGRVFPALSVMHELGVLGRFMPEFDKLTCLVQHEFYHRYTADIHTLHAIRELDTVYTSAEPATQRYRDELHQTADPTLLYLILLLHDIGKGVGIKGHDEAGVVIAGPILERLRVAPEAREIVNFVIKNHLVMARFWQKHDLDDPQSSAAFAEIGREPDQLRYLYVHTYCDARSTSTSLWNGYKDALHRRLFEITLERLTLGADVETRQRERIEMTRRNIIAQSVPGVNPEEIDAHFHLLPERYFIQTDVADITLHIQMVNRLLHSIHTTDSVGSLRPVIEWKDDLNRSLTTVHIVTWDRAGLFHKLAGALSVAGLSILSARITTRTDHIAIDTFHVVEPGRGPVQSQKARDVFAKTVEEALVSDKDLLPEITAQAQKYSVARFTAENQDLQASFPPTVEVYHEISLQRIIVEVQARDQIGLLHRLGKTMSDHGFDITFARINTERGVALDTFYIEPADAAAPANPERLLALRDALAAVIAPAAAPAAS
ncbi:MAG TPA: [protein-PII] uridylyltransferase [Opitutaceae bacterium]|nr:[protein-PII] uridylyltransferase [Opitutaceae bacterium]